MIFARNFVTSACRNCTCGIVDVFTTAPEQLVSTALFADDATARAWLAAMAHTDVFTTAPAQLVSTAHFADAATARV